MAKSPTPKSTIVDYKLVPRNVSQLETPPGKTRCPKCWLALPLSGRKERDHFCRWNIAREHPDRERNLPMYRKPIFKRGSSRGGI